MKRTRDEEEAHALDNAKRETLAEKIRVEEADLVYHASIGPVYKYHAQNWERAQIQAWAFEEGPMSAPPLLPAASGLLEATEMSETTSWEEDWFMKKRCVVSRVRTFTSEEEARIRQYAKQWDKFVDKAGAADFRNWCGKV